MTAKFTPYFCAGCGVTVTREPWPHLDRNLLAGMAEAETPPTPAADHGGHEGLHQHRLGKPEAAGVVARPPDSSEEPT